MKRSIIGMALGGFVAMATPAVAEDNTGIHRPFQMYTNLPDGSGKKRWLEGFNTMADCKAAFKKLQQGILELSDQVGENDDMTEALKLVNQTGCYAIGVLASSGGNSGHTLG